MLTFVVTIPLAFATIFASPIETAIRSGSAKFTYDPTSNIGPTNWGNIDDFKRCGTGESQSPIDVSKNTKLAPVSNGPFPKLKETELKFGRTTENFELDCEKEGTCGFTMVKGKRFNLVNLHFHSNSEHKIFGKQFLLESHKVHRSDDGNLLVIGTFYKIVGGDDDDDDDDNGGSKENPVIEDILDQLEAGKEKVTVNLPGLLGKGYIGYSGSLTTPPCTEGVNWFIALTIQSVSKGQVLRYRKIAQSGPFGNNRPIQKLNNRVLKAFIRKSYL